MNVGSVYSVKIFEFVNGSFISPQTIRITASYKSMLDTYFQPEYIAVRGVKVNINATLTVKIGLI